MHNHWGFLVPIKSGIGRMKLPFLKIDQPALSVAQRPHVSILNETETIRLFFNAVRNESDDPRAYMSRNLAESIDLNELRKYFGSESCYTCLQKAGINLPGAAQTNSILIMDSEQKSVLMHLHLMREPGLGQWKIYDIEKE